MCEKYDEIVPFTDACIRPLFANSVTYEPSIISSMIGASVVCVRRIHQSHFTVQISPGITNREQAIKNCLSPSRF